ncbi:MAG: choice-of-anchor J domain-containing protein [Janthinobacterium lividum]
MKKSYTRTTGLAQRLRQVGLTALLAVGATVAAHAQLTYAAASVVNAAGTYTDLGTTGTAITTTNTDDANSAAQNIGFTFTYNGTAFTQFVFNTNGVIRLGSAAPSTASLYYDNNTARTSTDPLASTNAADVNLLMPFNQDLVPGSNAAGADYRVLTSGTAPNRVCTIQWRNVADKAGAGSDVANVTQFANFSFQIKLYETTNNVEFVYDQAVAGTGAVGVRFPNVGLKGSGLASGQLTVGLKAETAAWSTTTFQNVNYGSSAHNITKAVGPDAGRTYRFVSVAPVANDVAVQAVYALGKVATPNAVPQAVRVYVANLGTAAQTNLAITLTISGANTYTYTATVATLAAGAAGTLTFPAAPATLVTGTNTITVSVPSDGNNTNNSVSVQQLVTTNRLSHIAPNLPTDAALSGSSSAAGYVLTTKYTVPNTVYLSEALISFANITGGPTTAFQVVVQDATGTGSTPGSVLYTSPTQNRPATGGDVAVAIPSLALTGSFFVGVKEIGTTGAGIATQSETPLRNTTFYFSATGAAPWTDIAATTLARRLAIEIGLSAAPNCAAPAALALTSATANSAVISFTDASNSGSYQLVYGAVGFTPTTGGTTVPATASPATITGLQPGTTYQVYIRANCTAGGQSVFSAPLTFSTPCATNTTITAFPYTEAFDNIASGAALPCGFTVLDANNDAVTWRVSTENPNSGTRNIRYQGLLATGSADDWFFTPALTLPATANTRFQVAFAYRAAGSASTGTSAFTEALEVKSGTAATVAGQTNLLYTNNSINNLAYAQANGTSAPVVAFLPAGASTQYVGFHVKSPALQSNLYIDDLSVTAVTVTATTSEALLRAVTVSPNPSTSGVFNLNVSGANAQKGLEVTVVNNLGQRVYAGTARDNFTTQIDLSRLAGGLYHLQVKNGDEYMVRQIAILK